MRLNACFNEIVAAFIKGCRTYDRLLAEMEISPQEEMADPQDMKLFPVERHGLP